jgi:cell division septal protein FtsQ
VVEPGKKLADSSAREALAVLAIARQGSEECYRRISEVHVSDDHDLLLYTNEGGVPVFFGRGETAMKLAKFDTFWEEMGRSAGDLQYVDLRFQNQVIARWNRN